MAYQGIFKRKELKYMLDRAQYETVLGILDGHMKRDEYGRSIVSSLYFDTPDYRLIRASMQKPTYKEKLRLRTYGIPTDNSLAFAEIKKKYKGIVYKRRVMLPYNEALMWLCGEISAPAPCQISREIDYLYCIYPELRPSCVLCYDRVAYYSEEDEGLRVTFDESVRYRFDRLDLRMGDTGTILTGVGQYLMEIKIPGGMPVWLARGLSDARIFPISYSKYARAFQNENKQNTLHTEEVKNESTTR